MNENFYQIRDFKLLKKKILPCNYLVNTIIMSCTLRDKETLRKVIGNLKLKEFANVCSRVPASQCIELYIFSSNGEAVIKDGRGWTHVSYCDCYC
jgi:hypothetical protein